MMLFFESLGKFRFSLFKGSYTLGIRLPTIMGKMFGADSSFMWSRALREGLNFYFSGDIFTSIEKKNILGWLSHNLMKFWDSPDISQFAKIISLKSFVN